MYALYHQLDVEQNPSNPCSSGSRLVYYFVVTVHTSGLCPNLRRCRLGMVKTLGQLRSHWHEVPERSLNCPYDLVSGESELVALALRWLRTICGGIIAQGQCFQY